MISATELQKIVNESRQKSAEEGMIWAKEVLPKLEEHFIKQARSGCTDYFIDDSLLKSVEPLDVGYKAHALSKLLGDGFSVIVSGHDSIRICWAEKSF